MDKIQKLKLTIELVPLPLWHSNLRKVLSHLEWDKIRKQSYADANHKCAICGVKAKLNCHEIWEYNDKKHVQKLTGFIALCDNCHMIKHIGFAGIQASKGLLDMNELVEHFIKVNNVDFNAFRIHYNKSFGIWKKRSKLKWKTDFSYLKK